MAKETLNVVLDHDLIERVRRYSAEHGMDVAGTISELIASLPPEGEGESVHASLPPPESDAHGHTAEAWVDDLPPLTRSLLGAAAGDSGEEDYKEFLLKKYGQ